MRNTCILFILIFLFSCAKKTENKVLVEQEYSAALPYDTVAVDSFSQGATSVDIARKLKISSIKYQDSLKKVKLKNEEEKLLNKAKEERAAAEKKASATLEKEKVTAASSKIE